MSLVNLVLRYGEREDEVCRLLAQIGSGGMASVYRALDEARQATVAVKVLDLEELRASGKSEQEIQNLARCLESEMRILRGLNNKHPHIVPFFEAGKQGDISFIVMGYVPGGSLAQRLADVEGPLPVDEVVPIVRAIGGALHFVHRAGIIHGDVKPENIILDDKKVYLADFGIASEMDAPRRSPLVMGTEGYIAPEQYAGRPASVASDIYALGVVAYQALSGKIPLRARLEVAQQAWDVGQSVSPCTTPAPPLYVLNPEVTRDMDAVIQAALEIDPRERCSSAGKFGEDLEAAWKRKGKGDLQEQKTKPLSQFLQKTQRTAERVTAKMSRLRRAPAWLAAGGILVISTAIALVLSFSLGGAAPPLAGERFWVLRPSATPLVVVITAQVTVPAPPPSPAPSATITLTSSPTPSGTASPTATKMARPTETATLAPTATATATATPRPVAPCRITVGPSMSGMWERRDLGCALAPAEVAWSAWQPFDGGSLLWRSDTNHVLALFSGGSWRAYTDHWEEGTAIRSRGSPPPNRQTPDRGFGYLWGQYDELFERLQWATEAEMGFCAEIQVFDKGIMLRSQTVANCLYDKKNRTTPGSFPALTIIVYNSGNWVQR